MRSVSDGDNGFALISNGWDESPREPFLSPQPTSSVDSREGTCWRHVLQALTIYRLDYGQEEAAAKFGADPRIYLTTATKFEGDANGQVNAVHTVEVKWEKNDKGQFIPKNVPGTEKVLSAQLVLLAMGFLGPEQPLLEALGIERDVRSNAKADFEKYTTNIPSVFACGDCRRGQSLVVWAFNEGRGAARECDRFLMGATDLP